MNTSFTTVAEFCTEFRLGKTKVYELLNSGAIRSKKVGSKTLIDVRSVREWVENLPDRLPTYVPTNGGFDE